jgi:succinyl-diaminopimelate desuccinylase
MAAGLAGHGLSCRRLAGPGSATVALTCEVPGGRPGPRFVLDACLDTAPFGDEAAWTYPPASGEITRGWLHGRGSADSKAGAAIFAHVAARLRDAAGGLDGSVVLLFDVDEHTGGFGGAKAYFEDAGAARRVDGVMTWTTWSRGAGACCAPAFTCTAPPGIPAPADPAPARLPRPQT